MKKMLRILFALITVCYVVVPANAEAIEYASVRKMTTDEIAEVTLTTEYSYDEYNNETKQIYGIDSFKHKLMVKRWEYTILGEIR